MDFEPGKTALILARSRAIVGAILVFFPGLASWLWFGESSARTRALLRMVGVRDLVLGVGALTSVKEHTQDAEWVGMGAVADAVDGIVTLTVPGLPMRGRLVGPVALGSAFIGFQTARQLADTREAAASPD
jgi:hypothetical protein